MSTSVVRRIRRVQRDDVEGDARRHASILGACLKVEQDRIPPAAVRRPRGRARRLYRGFCDLDTHPSIAWPKAGRPANESGCRVIRIATLLSCDTRGHRCTPPPSFTVIQQRRFQEVEDGVCGRIMCQSVVAPRFYFRSTEHPASHYALC